MSVTTAECNINYLYVHLVLYQDRNQYKVIFKQTLSKTRSKDMPATQAALISHMSPI